MRLIGRWIVRFVRVVVAGWTNELWFSNAKTYVNAKKIVIILNQVAVNCNNCCL